MNGLSLQSFDLNEAIFGKISGSQKATGKHVVSRDSGSFERLLQKATGTQEEPRPDHRIDQTRSKSSEDGRPEVRREARPEASANERSNASREKPSANEVAEKGPNARTSRTDRPEEVSKNEITDDSKIANGTKKDNKINNASTGDVKNQQDTQGAQDTQDTKDVSVKLLVGNDGTELKIIIQGLPAELLKEVLALLNQQADTLTGLPVATQLGLPVVATNQASESVGLESDTLAEESLANFHFKLDTKLQGSAPDILKELQNLIAMVSSLAENAGTQLAAVQVHFVDQPQSEPSNAGEAVPQRVPLNEMWSDGALQMREPTVAVDRATTQRVPQTQHAFAQVLSEDILGLTVTQGSEPVDFSMFARLRIAVGAEAIATRVAEEPVMIQQRSSDSGSSTSLAEQGASTQSGFTSPLQTPDTAKGASFGTIVADRIAAIAEQIAMREKQMDVLLRLQTESGESLLVNLREQAGKIVVNVRSGDERIVNLLQSQKETIIRHLEEKHVTATVSVSPIGDEDLQRRERREQPRHQWAQQEKPLRPYVEASA